MTEDDTEDRGVPGPEGDVAADGALAARLRAADPARDLAPLPPDEVRRLVSATVRAPAAAASPSAEPDRLGGGVVDLSARRRRRFAAAGLGVAAAAAVVVGAVTVVGGGAGGTPDVVALQAPPAGGPAAVCAELTADALAGNDLAVAGEVTSVEDGTVTLTVTDRYTGELRDGDTLTLPQGQAAGALDGAPPVFDVGGAYLVAADHGVVATCGATAADSPQLRQVYTQAFPR